ncbi:MAG: hypothetical protein J6R18_10095 [Kiritimatiellae bacterium]|nr:hypothetical protein [Kiritimatiellia bacterium]
MLSIGLAIGASANGVNDAWLSFSTKGPDRYADGSVVMDGECYALIWSEDGKFEGFSANGECIDPNDRVVLLAPVAKDGRCPSVLFQIPAAEADVLSKGFCAVYLLDTRVVSEGKVRPSGSVNGRLLLLNGYGEASVNFAIKGSGKGETVKESGEAANGQVASMVSSVPSDCIQPRIKGIRIDGDNVFLTVENLKGFLRVSSGSGVSASDATDPAVEASGDTEDITLITRKSGDSGFFKVIRNGN